MAEPMSSLDPEVVVTMQADRASPGVRSPGTRPGGNNAAVRHVGEVHGPQGAFFVRAEPWNYLAPGWIGPVERMVEHDHSWVIHVRWYHDDPWGPIAYEERVPKDEVRSAIERVEREIRSGALPHPGTDSN